VVMSARRASKRAGIAADYRGSEALGIG
jgi:hypothetical protein